MKIGIYNVHMQTRGGGEKRSLALAEHLSRTHQVWLVAHESLDVPSLERYFDVDLSGVRVVNVNEHDKLGAKVRYRTRDTRFGVLAEQLHPFRRIKSLGLDIFVNNSYSSNLPCPSARGIYMCMFPHELPVKARGRRQSAYNNFMDRVEVRSLGRCISDFMDSYAVITANSYFTAEWVRKRWDRSSEVIYSACDSMGPPVNKEKFILNVGRFARGGADTFYKQQEILLNAFKELSTAQKDGWQLHLAGSVARDSESLRLVGRLMEAAKGHPVFFHFDAELDVLRDLYRRASIYWHATGYGFPVCDQPKLHEHFGMTTIEAMSAGVVPIVINSGGQKEIVTHGVDGFFWEEPANLVDQTARLIHDADLLKRLSREAVLSSARFSRAAFNSRMDGIIERLACHTYPKASHRATHVAPGCPIQNVDIG